MSVHLLDEWISLVSHEDLHSKLCLFCLVQIIVHILLVKLFQNLRFGLDNNFLFRADCLWS